MLGPVFTVVVLGVVMLAKWKLGKLQKTKSVILEANLQFLLGCNCLYNFIVSYYLFM